MHIVTHIVTHIVIKNKSCVIKLKNFDIYRIHTYTAMNTYLENWFGYSMDIFDTLIKNYDYYTKNEYIDLLHKAKLERDSLMQENEKLKTELATINTNIVTNLHRDLIYMQQQINTTIKPKYNIEKKIEQLDV